jgi:hypothetical protein
VRKARRSPARSNARVLWLLHLQRLAQARRRRALVNHPRDSCSPSSSSKRADSASQLAYGSSSRSHEPELCSTQAPPRRQYRSSHSPPETQLTCPRTFERVMQRVEPARYVRSRTRMPHRVKAWRNGLMVVLLGVAACPAPSAPSTSSGSDATDNSEQSGRIRRTEDERARRRELNGDAGPLLPQEPMQTSP